MAGFRIEGDLSNNVVEVNPNKELLVALAADEINAGYATATSEVDAGTVTGTRLMRDLEVSTDYRLRSGIDTPLFSEMFPGTVLNSAIWTAPVTTFTVTVLNGWLSLNAGASTAANGVARVQSYRAFPLQGTAILYLEFVVNLAALPVSGNTTEWGSGYATGTAVPTDGCYFSYLSDGRFVCAVNRAGTVRVTDLTSRVATLIGVNMTHTCLVGIGDRTGEFWIDDVLVADMTTDAAEFAMVASPEQPILLRTYNGAAITAAAQVLKVGQVNVILSDLNTTKLWGDIRAGAGDMGYQGPTGGTMGSTSNLSNSLAIGAGVAPTNTTAALGSGLGGQFTILPTLAVPTDGIIQSYQVPLGSVAVPGKTLIIKGVKISSIVSVALTGGPVVYLWSLAFGHNTVSLASTETATTKTARREPLGFQVFAANAVQWTRDDRDIYMAFNQPIIVQPGEFIQTVAKNIGVVTTLGAITATVLFDVGWE